MINDRRINVEHSLISLTSAIEIVELKLSLEIELVILTFETCMSENPRISAPTESIVSILSRVEEFMLTELIEQFEMTTEQDLKRGEF